MNGHGIVAECWTCEVAGCAGHGAGHDESCSRLCHDLRPVESVEEDGEEESLVAALRLIHGAYLLAPASTPANLRRAILDAVRLLSSGARTGPRL